MADLTEKQKLFVEALFSEEAAGNHVIALRMAGYGENTRFSDVIKSDVLAEAVVQEAKNYLARNSGKAAFALVNSLFNPSDVGVANKIKAAESILNRVGVKETSGQELKIPESGIVILPAKSVRVERDDDEQNTNEG